VPLGAAFAVDENDPPGNLAISRGAVRRRGVEHTPIAGYADAVSRPVRLIIYSDYL